MTLHDLKIGTQQRIGMGLVVVLVIALGTLAWRQTIQMETLTRVL